MRRRSLRLASATEQIQSKEAARRSGRVILDPGHGQSSPLVRRRASLTLSLRSGTYVPSTNRPPSKILMSAAYVSPLSSEELASSIRFTVSVRSVAESCASEVRSSQPLQDAPDG